jgi:hypothetical protein
MQLLELLWVVVRCFKLAACIRCCLHQARVMWRRKRTSERRSWPSIPSIATSGALALPHCPCVRSVDLGCMLHVSVCDPTRLLTSNSLKHIADVNAVSAGIARTPP